MVRPLYNYFTPATASTTYFASSVTGSSWTLTHTTTTDGLAHQITITNLTANDHSGTNVTITYYDENYPNSATPLRTYTMALPGPSATVTTTIYASQLVSVTPAATIGADTMSIGFAATFASRTIPNDWQGNVVTAAVIVTGTINYTVQYTLDNIQEGAAYPYNWLSDSGTPIVASTSSGATPFYGMPNAFRFIANSYSAGATAQMTLSQQNHNN